MWLANNIDVEFVSERVGNYQYSQRWGSCSISSGSGSRVASVDLTCWPLGKATVDPNVFQHLPEQRRGELRPSIGSLLGGRTPVSSRRDINTPPADVRASLHVSGSPSASARFFRGDGRDAGYVVKAIAARKD